MLLNDLLHTVWVSIKTHKLRSFLAIMGIIWGAYAVMMLFALGQGMFEHNKAQFGGLLNPAVIVNFKKTTLPSHGFPPGHQVALSVEQAFALPDVVPGVVAVSPYAMKGEPLSTTEKSVKMANVQGVAPLYFKIFVHDYQGRILNRGDSAAKRKVIFLSSAVKAHLFGNANAIGHSVELAGQRFQVVGYLNPKGGNSFNVFNAFIPFATYHALFPGRIHDVVLQLEPNVTFDGFKKTFTRYIAHLQRTNPSDTNQLQFWNLVTVANTVTDVIWGIRIFLGVCGLMTLVVGGISIANMMYLVVKERTAEIGLQMALGAEPGDIIRQVMLETIFLVGLGALIAIVLAYLSITGLQHSAIPTWFGMPGVNAYSMALIALVLLGVAVLAGFFPARRASRMVPIDALQGVS